MKLVSRSIAAIGIISAIVAGRAAACPVCQLGAAAIVGTYNNALRACRLSAAPTTQPTTQPSGTAPLENEGHHELLPFGLTVAGGADFTTAYYHRGYIMDDQGFIAQPWLNLAMGAITKDQFALTPYVGGWADIQSGGTHTSGLRNGTAVSGAAIAPMPCCSDSLVVSKSAPRRSAGAGSSPTDGDTGYDVYETDVTAGVAIDEGPLFVDLRYRIYTFPGGALPDYQEIGAKVSYDLVSLLPQAPSRGDFLVRPFVEFDHEIEGAARRKYNYLETGIEPSFVVPVGRTRIGVSLPVDIGMSVSNYYTTGGGSNQTLGFYSGAIKTTVPLPMPARFGSWYLTGTVTYLRLNADNLKVLNHGKADEVIGTLGVGFAY